MRRIYLDYASLTPIDPCVMREMDRYSSAGYANPSSIYREGVAAQKTLEDARKRTGDFIHAHADEIVFTSGGTEANNLAIGGALLAARRRGVQKPHLVISNIEHSSVMETAAAMEKNGAELTRLAVDRRGLISTDELKKAIKPNTVLVSIMTVNNEIGIVEPIREIAKVVRQARALSAGGALPPISPLRSEITGDSSSRLRARYPLLHTDAAQAALYHDLNVERLGVDLLTLDGGKVYGPRGVGALYVKRNTPIEPITHGGGQEKGMRSGTENIPSIMGFAKALDVAAAEREKETERIAELRAYFLDGLKGIRPDVTVNPAAGGEVSPHILNVSIPNIDNEFFVLQLDAAGVAVSTKSSCLRDEDESYVLKSIGADSKTSIRFSFGRWTKERDVKTALKDIADIIGRR
ncbi:MAG: cysteine desulfurase family protein [Minisyncoccia bacterium]